MRNSKAIKLRFIMQACGFAMLFAAVLPSRIAAQMAALHTSGRNIVDASGKPIRLEGVNLGGWLLMEPWMSPVDSSALPDMYSVMATLDKRFGVPAEQKLIRTYEQSWITEKDLDNIKNSGFNVVRVPVWWGDFYTLGNISNAGWRADAFTELDWLVTNAASRGLYVIIDMHGLVGGQNLSMDTGKENDNSYWTKGQAKGNSSFLWWQIANHFKGNPAIAGYDLINEPTGAHDVADVISAYAELYKTVRSVDPDHILFLQGTWGKRGWAMLPNPRSQGWTNVVYEMHEYQYGGTEAQTRQGATAQVADFNAHADYDCPGYIGEFNTVSTSTQAWKASIDQYRVAGLSWTVWSYKSAGPGATNFWGMYVPSAHPVTPDVMTDTPEVIASDWQSLKTEASFSQNKPMELTGSTSDARLLDSVAKGVASPAMPQANIPQPAKLSTSTWYKIVNQNSSLCVDAEGWKTTDGTTVQQYTCGAAQSNQQWQFAPQEAGAYAIFNKNAPREALNVKTSDNTSVQLWTYGGGSNEQWTPVSLGNDLYKLVNLRSHQCLQVKESSKSNNAHMEIGACTGTPSQAFSLTPP